MRWTIALVLVCCGIYGTLALINQQRHRQFVVEGNGFRELAALAREMIQRKEPGVERIGNDDMIVSFEAFFQYVTKRRPEVVSTKEAPNPFPGLLPGPAYGRSARVLAPNDCLIWSKRVYDRPIGRVRFRLLSNALWRDLEKNDLNGCPP